MSSKEPFEFNKDNIDIYLKDLSKEYRKKVGKNVLAEIILIGGASVLINYGFRNMTTDIDAIILASSTMKDVINIIGDKYNFPTGWLNQDFIKTDSYSPNLINYSDYYRTYSNVLTIRTIRAEYLISMKLKSGRQYKNDFSDIIGILSEYENSENPITIDQIKKMYLRDKHKNFIFYNKTEQNLYS